MILLLYETFYSSSYILKKKICAEVSQINIMKLSIIFGKLGFLENFERTYAAIFFSA